MRIVLCWINEGCQRLSGNDKHNTKPGEPGVLIALVQVSLDSSSRTQPLGEVVTGDTPCPRQSRGLHWLLQNLVRAYLANPEQQSCMPTTST